MIDTFDKLADFYEKSLDNEQTIPETSAVDLSAVINRLNDLEQKINDLMTRTGRTKDTSDTQQGGDAEQKEGNGNASDAG